MNHWHALYTKPHKEYHVHQLLESKGFETYLPEVKVKKNGRWKAMPFFSCYLFVRVGASDGLSSLRWTPGLKRIVSFGDEPAIVDDSVVSFLRQRLSQLQESGYATCRFKPGERIIIKSGPLSYLEAVFEHGLSSGQRARILVDFLGRWTPCRVDMDCLEKAR